MTGRWEKRVDKLEDSADIEQKSDEQVAREYLDYCELVRRNTKILKGNIAYRQKQLAEYQPDWDAFNPAKERELLKKEKADLERYENDMPQIEKNEGIAIEYLKELEEWRNAH